MAPFLRGVLGIAVALVAGCVCNTNLSADAGLCKPKSCADEGVHCGTVTDGCGGVINCGSCTPPEACGGGGVPNSCGQGVCTPESDTAFCTSRQANCGQVSSTDNCGNTRTVASCGTCTPPEECGGSGSLYVCGCPASCFADAGALPDGGSGGPPNVVIVLDKSGSMEEPPALNGVTSPCDANTNAVCCTTTGGYGTWCAAGGPTPTCNNPCKWADAIDALTAPSSGFVTIAAAKAQVGYVGFPSDALCGAPTQLDVPIAANNAAPIISALQNAHPGGGTPTSLTLQMIAALPNLVTPGKGSFVVLITDGLPNCNSANWSACQSCNATPSTCTCPVNPDGSDTCCNPTTSAFCGNVANLNSCLDGAATVTAIANLRQGGTKTIVVGFGQEATFGLAGPLLSAMANAGGMQGLCGGTTAYCAAADAPGLQSVLATVAQQL